METRVIVMGAAGRDFHNFNVVFRDDPRYRVVAFTATQIPNIEGRRYPAALAGKLYPEGIPIHPESELTSLIETLRAQEVIFAYSDVSHENVMHKASIVLAAGPDFRFIGPDASMIKSKVPIVSVCAVRTGAGKSQTTRKVCQILRAKGRRTVAIRHPMPYGDLVKQRVQRFAAMEDLDIHKCTIEEREEYEPHIAAGGVIYAGVDYGAILEQAQQECDVLLWDGGNNDISFYRPTILLTVVDPLRPGHEITYHPGETNLRMADVLVINKVDSATADQIAAVERSIASANPGAMVIKARSEVTAEGADQIEGKRVLVIEDGPTLTHGEMRYGAGVVAAKQHNAAEIVDPRDYAVGTLKDTYAKYDIGDVLPAMGYSDRQLRDMEQMIDAVPADVVIVASPIDLRHLLDIKKPAVRVQYDLVEEAGSPTIADALAKVL
jgi:predicted GTPase